MMPIMTDADDAIATALAAIRRLDRHLRPVAADRAERDAAIARALAAGLTPGQVSRRLGAKPDGTPVLTESYIRTVKLARTP